MYSKVMTHVNGRPVNAGFAHIQEVRSQSSSGEFDHIVQHLQYSCLKSSYCAGEFKSDLTYIAGGDF